MARLTIEFDIHNRPPVTTEAWEVAQDLLHPDLPTLDQAAPPVDFTLDYVCSDQETHGRILSASWAVEEDTKDLAVPVLAALVEALSDPGIHWSADEVAHYQAVEDLLTTAQTLLATT